MSNTHTTTTTKPIGCSFVSYEQMAAFYGSPLPKRISARQFDWLLVTHAHDAGHQFILQRGDDIAMHRWELHHGASKSLAEAFAGGCINEWMKRHSSALQQEPGHA